MSKRKNILKEVLKSSKRVAKLEAKVQKAEVLHHIKMSSLERRLEDAKYAHGLNEACSRNLRRDLGMTVED